jgi:hypothetical protein
MLFHYKVGICKLVSISSGKIEFHIWNHMKLINMNTNTVSEQAAQLVTLNYVADTASNWCALTAMYCYGIIYIHRDARICSDVCHLQS